MAYDEHTRAEQAMLLGWREAVLVRKSEYEIRVISNLINNFKLP